MVGIQRRLYKTDRWVHQKDYNRRKAMTGTKPIFLLCTNETNTVSTPNNNRTYRISCRVRSLEENTTSNKNNDQYVPKTKGGYSTWSIIILKCTLNPC